jgi:SAM-dependent methyltransferase
MTEVDVAALAVALGARRVGGPLSEAERGLADRGGYESSQMIEETAAALRAGQDPLGDLFCRLRPATQRRAQGAVYTPPLLVSPMVDWVLDQSPSRVVDAGAGSGRFALEIRRRAPEIHLVAVDADPLATLMTRAGLAVLGQGQADVINADYLRLKLPAIAGITAFIGNPPYVRHHNLSPATKRWAQMAAKLAGCPISGLAGLHALFYLATALLARPGDVGCFVTSSEWLDVNYGSVVRELLLGKLGGESLHVLEPTALPFADTATTAAISCFRVGSRPATVRLHPAKAVEDVTDLGAGAPIARERLVEAQRWTPLVRTRSPVAEGQIELGELCRVHRGQVTGANSVWITQNGHSGLPERFLFASVTRARELFAAGEAIQDVTVLRRVIDLPADLDVLDVDERRLVEAFLKIAKKLGAHRGYIAKNRKAWWSVGLKDPAPILATYMARRPPTFVRNLAEARHINIAHGLYPRETLPQQALDRLAQALRSSVKLSSGRTYAGGLTKFEPREMERLWVPSLEALTAP